jgi:predicted nucleic acid-binding protein
LIHVALRGDSDRRPANHGSRSRSERINLYGDGEGAAINLALERKVLLLIDDWRPYEAAQPAGVEVINSLAYLVGLYEQKRITEFYNLAINAVRE